MYNIHVNIDVVVFIINTLGNVLTYYQQISLALEEYDDDDENI
jgi:hypothetical protein